MSNTLKIWIFDRAGDILKSGKADRAVCLMDMPDDRDMEFQIERYKETFDRAISFTAAYSDTLWCYGNHDVSYPWGRLEAGCSPYAERTVMSKLEELENSLRDPAQINIIQRIDNLLFSHGGLTTEFVKRLDEDLLDADIDDVIAAVNDASPDHLWNDGPPLWLRPQNKIRVAFRKETYTQVVGHTSVEKIFEKDGIISTDVGVSYADIVNALLRICRNSNVDAIVERSRPGRGAHLWIFFKDMIPARLARRFGFVLLVA